MNAFHDGDDYDPADLIPLREAARLLRGRGGKAPSLSTLRRWANVREGYKRPGYDGPPVLLRTVRLGQDVLTHPDWVAAFERERLAAGRPAPAELARIFPRPERTRLADIRRAEE